MLNFCEFAPRPINPILTCGSIGSQSLGGDPRSGRRGDIDQPGEWLPLRWDTIQASAGDLISAGPAGSARLTYDDGCVARVRPNTTATSPCQAGYLLNNPGFVGQLGPFGIGAAAVFTAFCSSACDR